MSDPGHDVMIALADAAKVLEEQTQWGTSAQDVALRAVLNGAQGAVVMFDGLAAQVAALEQRVAALENPPSVDQPPA